MSTEDSEFVSHTLSFSPPSPRVDGRPLDKDTTIKIDGKNVNIDADDLESMCILGRGAYGVVEKVRHIKTGTILAVKVSSKIGFIY